MMRLALGMVSVVVVALVAFRTPSAQGRTVSVTTTTTPTPTTPCPTPVCALLIGCRPVTGSDGCPSCSCSDYNCDDVTCGPDQECVMQDVECPPDTTPCFPQPTCIPPYETTTSTVPTSTFWCPMITCFQGCQMGTDSFGCSTCDCPSCADISCAGDERCELVSTSGNPYFPEPVCVPETTTFSSTTPTTTPTCPVVTCGPYCNPDPFYVNGCPVCGCSTATCQDVVCDSSQQCVMEPVDCISFFMAPCFHPRCIWFDTTTATTATTATTITKTTPTSTIVYCRPIYCPEYCPIGTDSYGCSICECQCGGTYCAEGEQCVLLPTPCAPETTCSPQPACQPITDTTTISTTPLTTTSPCPLPPCAWFIGCRPVPGPDGCPICACPDYTCQDVTCGPDQECVMEDVECPPDTTPCFPQPTCVPPYETTTSCPMIKCTPDCVPDIGPDGCPFCACPPTCEDVNCTSDEVCELQQVDCIRAPCFPQPTCVSSNETTTECRMYKCAPDCVPDIGPDGCPICACPPTCEDVNCTSDEVCELQQVNCIRAPCFPQPTCVSSNESCMGTPNINRCSRPKTSWFYNSSANACQRFRYYGCTPSPNTFLSMRACEDKCKRMDPPICPAIACARGCYRLNRKNKCSKCICPDPCKEFPCNADEECQLREVTCFEEKCLLEPFCAARPNDVKDCELDFECPAGYCEKVFPPGECPQCSCVDCSAVLCIEGTVCTMQEVACKKAPCIPEPICVPIKEPCPEQPPCGIRCMNGLKTDENGCQLCECL